LVSEVLINLIKLLKYKKIEQNTQNNNIVYRINCKNCYATYVGQTKRQLKTRVKEHCNNIKLDKSRHSVISEHILNYNYRFDWEKVEF